MEIKSITIWASWLLKPSNEPGFSLSSEALPSTLKLLEELGTGRRNLLRIL
jgi:hypothetical protein